MSGNDSDIVIVGFARTAFDKFGGVCKNVPSIKLSEWTIRELVKRTGIPSDLVDYVVLGLCMFSEAQNETDIIARQALIAAGLRVETLSNNVDRACTSSTTALQLASMYLKQGESDVSIALGCDNMSRCSYFLKPELRWEGPRMGHMAVKDILTDFGIPGWPPLTVDAGEIALAHGITREMQDEWAVGSHKKYQHALEKGYIDEEIFPVEVPQGKNKPPIEFKQDANLRPDTSIEAMAKLKTVYGSPTVTAGNAPALSAGAAGVMVMSRKKAKELGLNVLATVLKVVSIATKPREIAVAPAPAIQKALKETGVKLDDIKAIEINEAFAAMPLVSTKILGDGDEAKIKKLRSITNQDGGAVALGHPVGASGLRITMHLMQILRRQGGGYGVAAICGGLAQGDAVVLKVE